MAKIGRIAKTALPQMKFDLTLDAKGLPCPAPLLRTKRALFGLKPGQILCVQATDPKSVGDLAAYAKLSGHTLLEQRQDGEVFIFIIRCDHASRVEPVGQDAKAKPRITRPPVTKDQSRLF